MIFSRNDMCNHRRHKKNVQGYLMPRAYALKKKSDPASVARAKAHCKDKKKGPRRAACVAAYLHEEPKAYLRARRKCKGKQGRERSACIVRKYLEHCRKVDESVCLDKTRGSRLNMFHAQKWVYLRPLLQEQRRLVCGTLASRKGHACRPTVRVEGARAKTVDDMLNDPEWLPRWEGANVRKLNRLAAYKDARGSEITMYWGRGRYRDTDRKTVHDFRPFNAMSEKEFRRVLRTHDKQVAKEFEDIQQR